MSNKPVPVIQVENLVKRYKKAKVNAVDNISFSVNQGEFFAFLGPNGAGKTTTISILTTTLAKTSGKITIAGHDLDQASKKVRQNVGIIFQNPSLDLELSAEENIRLHASLYGEYGFRPAYALMPAAYKSQVKELAELVGLENDLFKPMKTFSGGMKRKLEIVRSLMHNPQILFLDEPTSGLDPLSRNELWKYLQTVREKHGTTIFLTTHYLDEAEGADRICIVDKGRIASFGTPAEIKRTLVQDYMTIDAADRAALRAELKKLSAHFEGAGPFKVRFDGDTAQHLIQRIKTPLIHLEVRMPTLEEAYINMIAGEVI
ncbi:MAG: transporter ATP-binding protein [Patescibacteria group bacterium]|nr:transporter ATP-binding protein [Patescibacteria group bacterium]